MTDPAETAKLVDQITGAYREHAAEETEASAVPGRVLGGVEGQADALADAAERLAELLTAFTREPHRSLEPIAVFRRLSPICSGDGDRGRGVAPPGMVRP
jgi:hypothetical protein